MRFRMNQKGIRFLFALIIIITFAFSQTMFLGCPIELGWAPTFGLYGHIDFNKAPKTNETANLRWRIKGAEAFEELHAWVSFEYDSGKPGDSRRLPLSEVKEKMLMEGQVDFDGSLKEGEEKRFDASIKFPAEGRWEIGIYFLGKSVSRDLTQGIGAGIPYYAGTGVLQRLYITEEYGQFGFPKYYDGDGQMRAPNDVTPVSGYVDMEKPPSLNEHVEITWGVGSIRDIERVYLRLKFEYMVSGSRESILVLTEEIVISGDKVQQISSISKNEQFKNSFHSPPWNELDKTPREVIIEQSSVHFSTITRFPKEGDWKVMLEVGKGNRFEGSSMSILCFNISEDQSTWGWKEKHR